MSPSARPAGADVGPLTRARVRRRDERSRGILEPSLLAIGLQVFGFVVAAFGALLATNGAEPITVVTGHVSLGLVPVLGGWIAAHATSART